MKKANRHIPWWRSSSILGIILFRATILGTATSGILLIVQTARAYYQPTLPGRFDLWQVVSESFMLSAGWGLALAAGFGIPAGIIDVLARREREVALGEEIELKQEKKTSQPPQGQSRAPERKQ